MSFNKGRNIVPIKFQEGNNLTIIIPAAGAAHRMRSVGPKCLIDIGGKTLLERTIEACTTNYPLAKLIVVTGFQSDRVASNLSKNAISVENERYEATNVARSIGLALRATQDENILIVYGDLIFDSSALSGLNGKASKAIIDISGCFDTETREIGIRLQNGVVDSFAYAYPEKWAQIAFFTGKELSLLRKLTYNREFERLYLYEVLNMMIEKGAAFEGVKNPRCRIMDIDTVEDIEKARGVFS